MSEANLTQTPALKYAAALLRKLVDPRAVDPLPGDYARLSGPILEIALAVMGEGRDKSIRRARLKAEASARNLDLLMLEVERADTDQDLSNMGTGAGWNAFDLADVVQEELPAISWLVKPYLPCPSVTAWFGKPKSMKSLLVLDLCLHVAGGLPWLITGPQSGGGMEVKQARVVWLDLENGSATLKRRMRAFALALGLGRQRGQLLAYSMPSPWPDLSQDENKAALVARIRDLGAGVGVLVIDHLGQALGAIDENSPLISQVMGNIRQIAEECNLAVVLIHHAKKGQGKDSGAPEDQLRGHGAILANVDAAYLIERDKGDRTQMRITPVAVRGPDVPTVGASFSFEQDANLELTQARFWRIAWRNDARRAGDAVLKVLRDGSKNYTNLVSTVKELEPDLSDDKIRKAIAVLEGTKEIKYKGGAKGAKIYSVADGSNED